jgi:hypothetical protein
MWHPQKEDDNRMYHNMTEKRYDNGGQNMSLTLSDKIPLVFYDDMKDICGWD